MYWPFLKKPLAVPAWIQGMLLNEWAPVAHWLVQIGDALIEQRPGGGAVRRQHIQEVLVVVQHQAIDGMVEVDAAACRAVRSVVKLQRRAVDVVDVIVDAITDLQDGHAACSPPPPRTPSAACKLDVLVARRLVVGLRVVLSS